MLSKLPSSSFRIRKVTHRPINEAAAVQGEVRSINMSSPANWYMMGGDISRVCWTATHNTFTAPAAAVPYGALSDTFDPTRDPDNRNALHWGAGACWASIRETLNSGGVDVYQVTDSQALRGLWAARGLSSKRVSELSNSGARVDLKNGAAQAGTFPVSTDGGRVFVKQNSQFNRNLQIPELITSGCSDRYTRAQGDQTPFTGPVANLSHGYSYSCPLSTFSRIGSIPIIPVGFLGAYNPSNGWSLEFRVNQPADATTQGANAPVPSTVSIVDLRVEATYIEVLDEGVQAMVEELFNKTQTVSIGTESLTARLELPFINYVPSSYSLLGGSTSQILRIPSNSPSVRGLLLVVRPPATNEFGPLSQNASNPRFKSVRVLVGGLCIQESYARERSMEAPDTMGGWLAQEAFRTSHLFSYYPPHEEVLKPDTAIARFLASKPGRITDPSVVLDYDGPNYLYISFENAPSYTLDGSEAMMAKGIDLRNIGEIRLELEYVAGNAANNVSTALAANAMVDVLLAEDEVYAVDRTGATRVTQLVL